jgi:heme-degrading protein
MESRISGTAHVRFVYALIGYVGTISELLPMAIEFCARFCILGLQLSVTARPHQTPQSCASALRNSRYTPARRLGPTQQDVAQQDVAQDDGESSQPRQQFYGIQNSNHGRIMIFAGGVPLRRNGAVIGAVGVSGGSGTQDQAVATAGASAIQG